MLSIDQIFDLEEQISDELARLEAEISESSEERAAISPDVSVGRLSRLDAMQMQEVAKEAKRRREERIVHLQLAIERIDQGTYGVCPRCREEIPYDRLKISPEAMHCGDCA